MQLQANECAAPTCSFSVSLCGRKKSPGRYSSSLYSSACRGWEPAAQLDLRSTTKRVPCESETPRCKIAGTAAACTALPIAARNACLHLTLCRREQQQKQRQHTQQHDNDHHHNHQPPAAPATSSTNQQQHGSGTGMAAACSRCVQGSWAGTSGQPLRLDLCNAHAAGSKRLLNLPPYSPSHPLAAGPALQQRA